MHVLITYVEVTICLFFLIRLSFCMHFYLNKLFDVFEKGLFIFQKMFEVSFVCLALIVLIHRAEHTRLHIKVHRLE